MKLLFNKLRKGLNQISKSSFEILSCPGFALPVFYLLFLLVVAFIFLLIGESLVFILETLVARLNEPANLLSTIEVQEARLNAQGQELTKLKNRVSQLEFLAMLYDITFLIIREYIRKFS